MNIRQSTRKRAITRSSSQVISPKKGFFWSLEREMSAQSPDEEMKSCGGKDEEVVSKGKDEDDEGERERESDGDENDSDEKALESSLGSLGDNHPFILPKIWAVNDFLPTMSDKVFNTLRDRYQIPNNILIRLPGKFEKCYSRKIADISMYDAMFAAGLRLPLMAFHRQLAHFGVVCQLNCPKRLEDIH